MSSKLYLNESQLIYLIRSIVEGRDDEFQYSEFDYSSAFLKIFTDWMKKNVPEKFWEYPIGFLIKKYSHPFLVDTTADEVFNDPDHEINRWDIDRIVKAAVKRGIYKFPSMYSEEKFTEKYKKAIPLIIENLDLPGFAQVNFVEEKPNFVTVHTKVFYSNMLLSDDKKSVNKSTVQKKITDFLENYLNVDIGEPAYGKVKFNFPEIELVGVDEWVKDVLNKIIKPDIKKLPNGNSIQSIRFKPSNNGGTMKLVFKWTAGYSNKSELRESIKEYLKSIGINNKLKIEI